MKKFIFIILKIVSLLALIGVSAAAGYFYRASEDDNSGFGDYMIPKKPVIYLYPTQVQQTNVQLDFDGEIIFSYPDYNETTKGWEVTAYPDGRLINLADKREYSYLFWEGEQTVTNYNLSTGFVVKGSETKQFLQATLAELGLTPKEYNEFIVYWLPELEKNPYNLIHFAGKEYTDRAKLTVTPEPDSVLRVFMVYKPLNEAVKVSPQTFSKFERKGFTVVEWGGAEFK